VFVEHATLFLRCNFLIITKSTIQRSIYRDRLGTNIGKVEKKRVNAFPAGMDGSPAECPPDSVANKEENSTGAGKTPFSAPLDTKNDHVLPR
jgi:hypothetical protein